MAGFFNTIILLGAIQGLILSSLLFFSKKNRRSNRILAALILLIAMCSFNLYGSYKNWFDSGILQLVFQIVPLVIVMPFGPLVYFYVQSLLDPDFSITKKQRRHFYPAIIDLVPSVLVIVFIAGVLIKRINPHVGPSWGVFIDNYNVYADIPRFLSVTIYVLLSAKYLSVFKIKKAGNLNGMANSFSWLQQFIRTFIAFQAIWLIYLIPYEIPKYTDWVLTTFAWYPIYIPMTILIYWLGIKGYIVSQQQVMTDKKTNANIALSQEQIQQAIASLIKAMETDKVFLNPGLKLATMSASTGIAQKTISAVLNQHLQKSFNEFVNGYRIDAFKEKIRQPEMNNLTIAGVAQECGFNSQATFQRTFKEITGKSPSEFRKSVFEIS